MNFHETMQTAKTKCTNARPIFRRRRLATLVAATVLLHACSSVPAPDSTQDSTLDDSAASQSRWNFSRHDRGTPMPRHAVVGDSIEVAPMLHSSVWQRMSSGFGFALEHNNEAVTEALDFYAGNQHFMQQVTERARPFLYLILEEIEARGLPSELALLPIVESAYNPNAVSRQNVVGLWQFMPATATAMGLTSDWWYDARRDPMASTSAALDYLESLYDRFDHDWLFALAAYNMGQGNLQRAITRNEEAELPTDFWSLQLPVETTRHVPRVLALAHLLNDPEQHDMDLELIPDQPYLVMIDAQEQVDLSMVAEIAGIEPEVVYRLNPGYRQWATHPDGPHTIALPLANAERFQNGMASLFEQQRITWDRYVIQAGDTLGGIASRYRTRVATLQSVNALQDSRIVAGQTLLIPRAYRDGDALTPPDAPVYDSDTRMTAATYQVRSGDSLWRIANTHQMSVDELRQWNNLSGNAVLQPGQTLRLQSPAVAAMRGSAGNFGNTAEALRYRVRPGDSLFLIAREHNTSIEQLMELNRLQRSDLIHPGQQLIIRSSQRN